MLLDNGRSNMLGTEFQDMLRCIRCGACMNHCPVYQAVGGHAYGWVYPGPMGAVLTPSPDRRREGRAAAERLDLLRPLREVCPMRIPLPKMMRHWREREFEKQLTPGAVRTGLGLWAWFATRPALYRLAARIGSRGAPGCSAAARGPARLAAAGRRLDRAARHAGAAGADLHGPVEGGDGGERARAHPRAAAAGRRRRGAARDAEVAARLAEHPAGPVPAHARARARRG